MSYGDDGAVRESFSDGCLDEVVRLSIDVGRRLVQDEHRAVPQDGARQAHQLPLADAQVSSSFSQPHLQTHCPKRNKI